MTTRHDLSASMEDYLEVIHHLIVKHQTARVRDIADALDVKMPSVTGALRKLSQKGLVNYDPHQFITLTDEGERVAKEVARSHRTIARFLETVLDVDPETADKNACRMEHAVDDVVLSRLVKYLEYIETCPLAGAEFKERFGTFCKHGKDPDMCDLCMHERTKNMK
ncbi:MAG: metal-dependent transcriptional regulator [Deltaproteobacteria bacterium]|nr:metal-dependent transcriptional regulator [Candidatus Zymogenaceae bacterium]